MPVMEVRGPQRCGPDEEYNAVVAGRYEATRFPDGEWYILDPGQRARQAHYARLEWHAAERAMAVRAVELATGEVSEHRVLPSAIEDLCDCPAAQKGRSACYHRALARAWAAWRRAAREGARGQ